MPLLRLLTRKSEPAHIEWLVVGLGNPGFRYTGSRHNVGFMVVDRLARKHGLEFDERRNQCLIARGRINGTLAALAKPQTYMNLSGQGLAPLARFHKIPTERILVVYDDLDLPLGALRLRPEGGSGGHKGVESIIDHLGTRLFPRLRIGIGRPQGRLDPTAYVLQPFGETQQPLVEEILERAVSAIEMLLAEGVTPTMNAFNMISGEGA